MNALIFVTVMSWFVGITCGLLWRVEAQHKSILSKLCWNVDTCTDITCINVFTYCHIYWQYMYSRLKRWHIHWNYLHTVLTWWHVNIYIDITYTLCWQVDTCNENDIVYCFDKFPYIDFTCLLSWHMSVVSGLRARLEIRQLCWLRSMDFFRT